VGVFDEAYNDLVHLREAGIQKAANEAARAQ
jgi:hypothetical protein